MSKGFRQRVGLADAILHGPEVLILDEPTVGLDPKQIIAIRELIRDLGREHTLLLSTHILPEVELLCQKVLIIDRGRIIAQGTPEVLRQQWLGSTVVSVALKHGPADAIERLRALDGVVEVSTNGAKAGERSVAGRRAHPFSLECKEGSDPREAVFRLAVERGWVLLELKQSKASLEDIFVRLTTHERQRGGGRRFARTELARRSGVNGIRVTFARELRAYFFSPLAYGVLASFLFINGITFAILIGYLNDTPSAVGAPMEFFFGGTIFFWLALAFVGPILPMRMLSEERRSGSLEILMTAPVTETQVVVGKYLAALAFYLTLWLPTVLYAVIVASYSDLDWGPLASAYLGVLGIGALFLSVGLFASGITRNQIVAALVGFASCSRSSWSGCSSSWSTTPPASR